MLSRTGLRAMSALIGFAAAATAALAQPTAVSGDTADQRMDRFEQRLTELEQRYQQELKQRDVEIARLKQQLRQQTTPNTAAAATTTQPAAAASMVDEIERTKQEVLHDIEARGPAAETLRVPASFNPDLAVVVDTLGSYSPDRDNDAYNRFDVREAELDLRAAVDPRADGVVVLAFERDVENPVFAEEGQEENGGGPDSSANVEEAYIFLHDFGVPNLTAKLGRYHLRFGRQNILHLHDLPTVDPPFVNQAFLAPEALSDAGLSLSYVVPNPWDQYLEGIVEVISGEGADSESPTLAGDLSVDSPAINTHLLWNTDLTNDLNLELGGSWLAGHADADNARDVNLFGVDATLLHRDPTGGFNNQMLQAEAIYGNVDQDDGGNAEHAWGAYVLAQQQINRDWYIGIRGDWTQNPNDDSQEAWGISPYVSWYWSEFLRFRAQYQHRDAEDDEEDVLYFQCTFIFGAHPPHPYWAMK